LESNFGVNFDFVGLGLLLGASGELISAESTVLFLVGFYLD